MNFHGTLGFVLLNFGDLASSWMHRRFLKVLLGKLAFMFLKQAQLDAFNASKFKTRYYQLPMLVDHYCWMRCQGSLY